jgi:hypothetical protein
MGGYFGDGKIRFGVNCYGKRPEGTTLKTSIDIEKREKERICKQKNVQKTGGDTIAPFQPNQWSVSGQL